MEGLSVLVHSTQVLLGGTDIWTHTLKSPSKGTMSNHSSFSGDDVMFLSQ